VASFYIENFGCRATQADGAAIERQFQERGVVRAEASSHAQIVVLNTCTVTASADQDARAAIRRIHRENPNCEIVVTGCYAQRAPEEVAALPGVSRVIGNSHKHQLAEIASPRNSIAISAAEATSPCFVPLSTLSLTGQRPTTEDQRRIFVSDIFAHTELLAAPVFDASSPGTSNDRTRPNLKVQDGCDNRCSFCVIPFVRGQSRSLPLNQILSEVNSLVRSGYREVVISGINLGRWGRDLKPTENRELAADNCSSISRTTTNDQRFEQLVRAILEHTSLEKLRLSSIEPMDWSDELIGMMANSARIAKHAHVPLQSGSDRVLRAMHRKYRAWHYREKLEKIRAAMPTAAIGADVMVGFPGETEADFEETRSLIEDLPFTYLHVFTYSSRPGTPSAAMRDQVPVHIARERNRILRDLALEKKRAFMRSFIGKAVEVITLNLIHRSPDGDITEALTDNYLKIGLKGRHDPNRWLKARVEQVGDTALMGVELGGPVLQSDVPSML
jgi:threonylcarbamoyladenosine tRNA methylthiotransferase MtaB